jgi:hypothetical protein
LIVDATSMSSSWTISFQDWGREEEEEITCSSIAATPVKDQECSTSLARVARQKR